MKKRRFKTAYGARRGSSFAFKLPTRTKQSFARECDVNVILAQWQSNGVITHTNRGVADYVDLANATDYHASYNYILEAQEAFMELPSRVRLRFRNDPAEFLAFMADPNNANEMVSLGLATPRQGSMERAHYTGAMDPGLSGPGEGQKSPVSTP